jgi:hypothetical protein
MCFNLSILFDRKSVFGWIWNELCCAFKKSARALKLL